jgi:hypothetical protein
MYTYIIYIIYSTYIYYTHYIHVRIYIHILYSRGVEKRKDGLEFFGIKNSGGERERVRGEEERGETEGEKMK